MIGVIIVILIFTGVLNFGSSKVKVLHVVTTPDSTSTTHATNDNTKTNTKDTAKPTESIELGITKAYRLYNRVKYITGEFWNKIHNKLL